MKNIYFENREYQEPGTLTIQSNNLGVNFVNWSDATAYINGLPIVAQGGSFSPDMNSGESDQTNYQLTFASAVTVKSFFVIQKLPK
jgi:hypothetical protein